MATLTENGAAPTKKIGWLGLVLCQALGLAVLAFIVFALNVKPRLLIYAACFGAALLVIPRPNLIPYLFVASTFTVRTVFQPTMMFSVQIVDATFLLLIAGFVSNKRVDIRCAFREHRALFTALALFLLWTLVGYAVNFYAHEPIVNATSAFYMFNVVQLIAAVVVFSQPQWKEIRGKLVMFFILCSCFEIAVALAQTLMPTAEKSGGATGTLGVHHSMLGNVMALSAGVAACAFFRSGGKGLLRLFFAGVCLMSLVAVYLSASRGNIMGIALALPVAVFLGYRHKKRTLVVLFAGMAAALVLAWFSPVRGAVTGMLAFQDVESADLSAYGRILIWERVYEHLLYGPWLQKIVGIGVGTFNTLRFSYYLEAGTFTTGAHNNIMHVFVEAGFVGLAIFAAIFFVIIRRLAIMGRGGDNAARSFLLCTLALFFSGLTQETFWFNSSFGRFWLQYTILYLILFNFNDKHAETKDEESQRLLK